MLHTVLVVVHAASAVAALVLGVLAFPRGRFLAAFLAALATTVVSLALAVAVGWTARDAVLDAVFGALVALGAVMCWRGVLAARRRPAPGAPPSRAHLEHVGFVLVSLTDAFLVVTVLNAGAPVWAVVATGVVVGVGGRVPLAAATRRVGSPAPEAAAAPPAALAQPRARA